MSGNAARGFWPVHHVCNMNCQATIASMFYQDRFCKDFRIHQFNWRRFFVLLSFLWGGVLAVCSILSNQHTMTSSVGSRPSMPQIKPSRAASYLQQAITKELSVGVCAQGSSLWQGLPDEHCQWQPCMWSERERSNIDLWLNVFSRITFMALECSEPKGGQTATQHGKQPEIAFVVTMHNEGRVAAQCLLELFRTAREVSSAEYILVDDGSTEDVSVAVDTGRQLQYLFGVAFKLVRNEEPIGYGPANNAGVQAASAKFIALLHCDAHVINGWLRPLIKTIQSGIDVGMVGPLLIGDGNVISSASSLILADAGAEKLYTGLPVAQLPSFINRRFRADMLSTAAIVIDRKLYLDLEGFDSAYSVGYWNGVDLAVRVRQAGFELYLQPLSIIYHQEGGSFETGTDSAASFARKDQLMADDKAIFRERWLSCLELSSYYPAALGWVDIALVLAADLEGFHLRIVKESSYTWWGNLITAEQHCSSEAALDIKMQRLNSPSVLCVDGVHPQPSRDSGSLRAEGILKVLVEEGFSVTFASTLMDYPYTEPLYATQMRFAGVEVWLDMNPNLWPLTIGEGGENRCRFDVIFVARKSTMESILPLLRLACPSVPIVFDTVDVHFVREARARMVTQAGTQNPAAADTSLPAIYEWLQDTGPANAQMQAFRNAELKMVEETDLTIVVSEQERSVIHHYLPLAPVHIVSNIMPAILHPISPCAQRQGLLFVGSLGHLPNMGAIEHLFDRVLPALHKIAPALVEDPEFRIHIVGSRHGADTLARLDEYKDTAMLHVNLSSELLELLLARVRVFVAPLLVGGGVKGKVMQAMANGLPVVSYKVGVEGLNVRHGEHAMVARDTAEFADHIAMLHENCSAWSLVSRGGLELIYKDYLDTSARMGLKAVIHKLAVQRPDPRQRHCTLKAGQ